MIYKRQCLNPKNNPKCKGEIFYKYEKSLNDATNKNTLCRSCCEKQLCEIEIICKYCNKLFKSSNKKRKFCSKKCSNSGENNGMYGVHRYGDKNPMYGKHHSEKSIKLLSIVRCNKNHSLNSICYKDIWIKNYSIEEVNILDNLRSEKISKNTKIAMDNKSIRQHLRLKAIERIERTLGSTLKPSYNISACEIIDWINMYYGYNFQHATNIGEYNIKELGCWVDAYDKQNNIVIEFYERAHYKKDGKLKEKELRREKDIIEHLNCEFIRINAFDKNNLIMEKIT